MEKELPAEIQDRLVDEAALFIHKTGCSYEATTVFMLRISNIIIDLVTLEMKRPEFAQTLLMDIVAKELEKLQK